MSGTGRPYFFDLQRTITASKRFRGCCDSRFRVIAVYGTWDCFFGRVQYRSARRDEHASPEPSAGYRKTPVMGR